MKKPQADELKSQEDTEAKEEEVPAEAATDQDTENEQEAEEKPLTEENETTEGTKATEAAAETEIAKSSEESEKDQDEETESLRDFEVTWECGYYDFEDLTEYVFTSDVDLGAYDCEVDFPEIIVEITGEKKDEMVLTAIADDTEITVTADAGVLPEGTVLKAEKITDTTRIESVKEAIQASEGNQALVQEMEVFDITLWDKAGNEIQPDTTMGEIHVSMKNLSIVEETDLSQIEIYHFETDETSAVSKEEAVVEEDSVKFEVEHFSVLVITNTGARSGDAEVNGTEYPTLTDAINAITGSGEIKLLDNIQVGTITIPKEKNITLDLGGKSVTPSDNSNGLLFDVSGHLTLLNGTVDNRGSTDGGNVIQVLSDAVLTVKENTKIYGAYFGIYVHGNNPTVNVNGAKIEAKWYPVSGNGRDTKNSIINITDGILTSTEDVAIYHPQSGTLTITGGKISGVWCGVQMCGGNLTISGNPEISATSTLDQPTKSDLAVYEDGTLEDGAAVSIISRNGYQGKIHVDISGGTFTSNVSPIKYYGVVANQLNSSADRKVESVKISGGTFISGGSKEAIKDYYEGTDVALAKIAEITGGSYSTDVQKHLKEGYLSVEYDKGIFHVCKKDQIQSSVEMLSGEDKGKQVETIVIDRKNSTEPVKFALYHQIPDIGSKKYKIGKIGIIGTEEEQNDTLLKCEIDENGNGVLSLNAETEEVNKTLTVTSELGIETEIIVIVTEGTDSLDVENGEAALLTKNAEKTIPYLKLDGVKVTKEQQEQFKEASGRAVEGAIDSISSNTAAKEVKIDAKDAGKKISSLGITNIELADEVEITVKQELKNVTAEQEVTYDTDENGNKTVKEIKAVIKSVTYQIDPVAILKKKVDEKDPVVMGNKDGDVFELKEQFYITFRIPVPSAVNKKYAKVEHNSATYGTSIGYYTIQKKDGHQYIEYSTNHFSEFTLTFTDDRPVSNTYRSGSFGSSGGSGGGGSVRMIGGSARYTDPVKGIVDKTAGIITGANNSSGGGYSHWKQDANGWWLEYANGSYPAGTVVKNDKGEPEVVYHWEMINERWWAFDERGYVKNELFFDKGYNGYFFIDANHGLVTGWKQIGDQYYYFNTVSDGTKGLMLKGRKTPDGYFVKEDGAWDGNPKEGPNVA